MNYKLIYDSVCERGKSRSYDKKVHQRHHIIPRCLGGSDDKNNLTCLTVREHYFVHKLLVEIYPDSNKLKFALRMMLGTLIKKKIYFSSRDYARITAGVKHSEETRKKLSLREPHIVTKEMTAKAVATRKANGGFIAWNKGKKIGKQSDELVKKRTKQLVGRKHSSERIEKAKKSHKKTISKRKGLLLQFDKRLNLVGRYESILDIDKTKFKVSNLREAILNIERLNRSGYYKGYFWRYEKMPEIDHLERFERSKLSHTPKKYRKQDFLV